MRFLLNTARRSAKSTPAVKANKKVIDSFVGTDANKSHVTKSWGQQCSPTCGCVLRFEATVDKRQRIIDCDYTAKSVVTTIDQENGGRLRPLYTTRTTRLMFQECNCQSIHALAKQVTDYLPNKRFDHIKGMNDFASIRSSIGFRHSVLVENDLPRTDTHCFDIVEEAFTGMISGKIPSRRPMDAAFKIMVAAESLRSGSVVFASRRKRNNEKHAQSKSHQRHERKEGDTDSFGRRLGVDRNRINMSTSKTMSTLGMFDINAENWLDDEEYDRVEYGMNSTSDRFDWVSYVDDLYLVKDSA